MSRVATPSPFRSTRVDIPWQSESKYIVPCAEKDGLPHASEGMRLGISKFTLLPTSDTVGRGFLKDVDVDTVTVRESLNHVPGPCRTCRSARST